MNFDYLERKLYWKLDIPKMFYFLYTSNLHEKYVTFTRYAIFYFLKYPNMYTYTNTDIHQWFIENDFFGKIHEVIFSKPNSGEYLDFFINEYPQLFDSDIGYYDDTYVLYTFEPINGINLFWSEIESDFNNLFIDNIDQISPIGCHNFSLLKGHLDLYQEYRNGRNDVYNTVLYLDLSMNPPEDIYENDYETIVVYSSGKQEYGYLPSSRTLWVFSKVKIQCNSDDVYVFPSGCVVENENIHSTIHLLNRSSAVTNIRHTKRYLNRGRMLLEIPIYPILSS